MVINAQKVTHKLVNRPGYKGKKLRIQAHDGSCHFREQRLEPPPPPSRYKKIFLKYWFQAVWSSA